MNREKPEIGPVLQSTVLLLHVEDSGTQVDPSSAALMKPESCLDGCDRDSRAELAECVESFRHLDGLLPSHPEVSDVIRPFAISTVEGVMVPWQALS